MRRFLRDLVTPSDFPGDAYGWVTNQLSHAALGLVAAWALHLQAGLSPVLAVVAFVAFEVAQLGRGASWRDFIEDTGFFCVGVWWCLTGGSWWLLAGAAVALGAGIWSRRG